MASMGEYRINTLKSMYVTITVRETWWAKMWLRFLRASARLMGAQAIDVEFVAWMEPQPFRETDRKMRPPEAA